MDVLVAIVIGAVAGWLASIVLRRNADIGWLGNIICGVTGSLLGNYVLAPIFSSGVRVSDFSLTNLFWSFIGALVVIGVYNLITIQRIR